MDESAAIAAAGLTMNEQPLLANLLNRLPPLFQKLSPVAQRLSQLQNDLNPENHSSI